MAFSKVKTVALNGLEPREVAVECDVSSGLPAFNIVGLADKSVEEAKERVRSAIKNSGFQMPSKRITINLSPADLKKAGTAYDLPIAVALLAASDQIKLPDTGAVFYGELSLDGYLKGTPGVLSALLYAQKQRDLMVFIPMASVREAELVEEVTTWLAPDLKSVVLHLHGEKMLTSSIFREISGEELSDMEIDLVDVAGQHHAKRVLEIAAAGSHNIFMMGSPGSGKTMLAKALISLLPKLTHKEAIEIAQVYSVAGLGSSINLGRPFRQPHHTSSSTAVVGGGSWPRPGEITLAHRGVLFLDEFLEFPRDVLEAMREPLESREIQVSRVNTTVVFPANFLLIAAANPCPCGYLGDKEKQCNCTPGETQRYLRKLSGPLLDRIDLQITVPRLRYEEMRAEGASHESSAQVRTRVQAARERQKARLAGYGYGANAEIRAKDLKAICPLDEETHALLGQVSNRFALSGRAIHRIIKTARTIADLEASEKISQAYVAEALQYRLNEAPTY